MKFLLYAKNDEGTLEKRFGSGDYGYRFLLRAFAPVLAELGEVIHLQDLTQADLVHTQCLLDGERCVLLSFAPLYKTPLGLSCPTVPVFCWEYPEIPESIEENSWKDDPRHDWRCVLAATGRAITMSSHSVEAVKRSMADAYPIVAIPPPIPIDTQRPRRVRTAVEVQLSVQASVADSRRMGLDPDGLVCLDHDDGTPFSVDDEASLPNETPTVEDETLDAPGQPAPEELLEASEFEPPFCGWELPSIAQIRTRLQGVIYVSVLSPEVARKNWEDLITAFCWAFRDTDDATLVLKLTGPELAFHHQQLLMLLSKLSPFRCRVIAINGYLSDDDYLALTTVATYYVNASLCEGLCLPLVEFLAAGVPAIAPDNTAMRDYIHGDLAFVIASYPGQPKPWPHGDNEIYRTSCHQLDWESLAEAYRRSHHVALHDPELYGRMSGRARLDMQAYCGVDTVKAQLHAFLCPEEIRLSGVPYIPKGIADAVLVKS